jgi:hypothetical protein
MIPKKHSFSIEKKINPLTNAEFGPTYGGTFVIRRPSLQDRHISAVKRAAALSAFGPASEELIPFETRFQIQIFSFVGAIACEALPEWFDPNQMYEDSDEAAVQAVAEEVTAWLGSFRTEDNPAPSGGSSE